MIIVQMAEYYRTVAGDVTEYDRGTSSGDVLSPDLRDMTQLRTHKQTDGQLDYDELSALESTSILKRRRKETAKFSKPSEVKKTKLLNIREISFRTRRLKSLAGERDIVEQVRNLNDAKG